MKQQIKLTECIGKTVEGFAFGGMFNSQFVMSFTDGTFVCLEALYEGLGELTVIEDELYAGEFDRKELIRLGIVQPGELEALEEKRRQTMIQEQRLAAEARDREEYERLKKKFGDA